MTDSNTPKLNSTQIIRKRPGMYIGGVDARALHHLFFEALDHAIDEAVIGRCDQIWITLLPENQVVIQDNSLGLPIVHVDRENMSMMEAVLERSGIFRDPHGEYEATGSSFGAGLRAVNALSSAMRVENRHNGQLWTKIYHEGLPDGPLQQIASVPDSEHGLKLTFTPDFTVLEPNPLDFDRIVGRCRELAYLIAGLKFIIRDERVAPFQEETTYAAEGLKTWIQDLNARRKPIHEIIHVTQKMSHPTPNGREYAFHVEFAFQFTKRSKPNIKSFANLIQTTDGGTHLEAVKNGILGYLIERLYLEAQYGKISVESLWEAVSKGLTVIVSIRHPYPSFHSSIELKLKNYDIFGPITDLVYTTLATQRREIDRKFVAYIHNLVKSNSPDSAV